MKSTEVTIDFNVMAIALLNNVKKKALQAGSTIVYRENGLLIKEHLKIIVKLF